MHHLVSWQKKSFLELSLQERAFWLVWESVKEKKSPLGLWLCCSSSVDVVKKYTSLEGHFQYEKSTPAENGKRKREEREDKEETPKRRKRKEDKKRGRWGGGGRGGADLSVLSLNWLEVYREQKTNSTSRDFSDNPTSHKHSPPCTHTRGRCTAFVHSVQRNVTSGFF